ncbi:MULTISPECIES: hypothetical protein [Fischerella]|uniref:Uncharacterized protein n=1 Tax=Fischerella muscicola CCMEE 5323 TaxID=2019572 RepID=A0A2N6K1G3_FISMU|nr:MULTISPECIES: hypothetical protein [Fischerella]MBD2430851.1 hypothetical protein [Fischerella sp. FACHB-380]PLZ88472.1 hypothetical protein CEN44_15395 [Fischerella muscicola CCMEE 5323]
MSYYDFDNHFWSPKQVCCQSKVSNIQKKINPKIKPKTILIGTFALVCAAISTTALIKNKAVNNNETYGNSSETSCIVLRRETFRMYCSLPQQ